MVKVTRLCWCVSELSVTDFFFIDLNLKRLAEAHCLLSCNNLPLVQKLKVDSFLINYRIVDNVYSITYRRGSEFIQTNPKLRLKYFQVQQNFL